MSNKEALHSAERMIIMGVICCFLALVTLCSAGTFISEPSPGYTAAQTSESTECCASLGIVLGGIGFILIGIGRHKQKELRNIQIQVPLVPISSKCIYCNNPFKADSHGHCASCGAFR